MSAPALLCSQMKAIFFINDQFYLFRSFTDRNYSDGEYGNVGAVLILCGFVGAFATGFILDHWKGYITTLKGAYFSAVCAWIFFCSNCRENNFSLLLFSAGKILFLPNLKTKLMFQS